MDRPRRLRRRDPRRTGPIRNAGELYRDGEPWRDSPQQGDDAASRGVREGYRLIEEQIRRGRRAAEEMDEEAWNEGPYDQGRRRRHWSGGEDERRGRGGFRFLEAQMRRTERLAQEILRQISSARPNPWRLAELIFRLYIESISDLALVGFDALGAMAPRRGDRFEEETERIGRDIDEDLEEIEELEEEELEDELWHWPAAPSVPIVIHSTVPIPVYVWSHERTEIDLDISPGTQSLDLEIERPAAAGTDQPPHPAFDAEFAAITGGPLILRITVPRSLPVGRYFRRVLLRATRESVGTLTVQVGTAPKGNQQADQKTNRKARKK